MTFGRRVAALLVVAVGPVVANARPVAAQTVALAISGLSSDSIPAAPQITLRQNGAPPGSFMQLEVATDPGFASLILFDASDAVEANFFLPRLLPERSTAFFRARLFTASGLQLDQKTAQLPVRSWVRLVSPLRSSNDVVFSRRPTFVWDASPLTLPPGPWTFELTIINTATNLVAFVFLADGSPFTIPSDLEANTSYRWRLHARALNSKVVDEVTVTSPFTFVIQSAEGPTATLFYNNFPNPFGVTTRSPVTCFWFDLARPTRVRLTILDVRLRPVKTIVPGGLPTDLAAGAYGRQSEANQTGCDTRVQWDGTDDRGRPVPPGLYYARFQGDGHDDMVKMLFKGR